jgi:hypothetical protein
MSTVSLDELLVEFAELALVGLPPEIVVVPGEEVHVDLDPVVVLAPNRLVDAVVEADPVDFRVLRALRPRRRATKAQKHTRMGE